MWTMFKGYVYYMLLYLNSMQTLFKCYFVCCSTLHWTISNLCQSYLKAICFICFFYLNDILLIIVLQELWNSLFESYVNCISSISLCYLETMLFLPCTCIHSKKLHSFFIGSKWLAKTVFHMPKNSLGIEKT